MKMSRNRYSSSINRGTVRTRQPVHTTVLHLTINSNVTEATLPAEQMDEITAHFGAHIGDYLKVVSGTGRIIDIEARSAIEIGHKFHKVHSHTFIYIQHESTNRKFVQLDIDKIRRELAQMGYVGFNVHVDWMKNSALTLEEYLDKYRTD